MNAQIPKKIPPIKYRGSSGNERCVNENIRAVKRTENTAPCFFRYEIKIPRNTNSSKKAGETQYTNIILSRSAKSETFIESAFEISVCDKINRDEKQIKISVTEKQSRSFCAADGEEELFFGVSVPVKRIKMSPGMKKAVFCNAI